MDFGKNRIQYKEFVWTYLDYDRFRVYTYQGGNEIARYVAYSCNRHLAVLERRLDFMLEDKISILVYNNQNDFKQSNLGLSSDDMANIGGVTRIVGDKVSVFFNGSHAELDQQIRAALAELLVNKYLYGGSARDMIRSSTLLNVPEWFTAGLVKYLSEGWTTRNDNLMYDDLKNDNYRSFNKLTGKQAAQAGHALWYYIASTFGESAISNLLIMTRINRSPESAFISSLGVTMPNIINDFTESFHRKMYNYRDTARRSPINRNSLLPRYRVSRHYYQAKISPDGKYVAYARTELGQIRVYLRDLESGRETRILKKGPKVEQMEDFNYPLLAWHPNGKFLSMIYPYEAVLELNIYDVETKESVVRNIPGFQKVNSFSYSPDGKKLAMSAVKMNKGQSDIFVFTVSSSGVEQLTSDIWDDDYPVFVKGGKYVVFSSNRISDTIQASDDANYFVRFNRNSDIFMANYPFGNKVLTRVARTPDENETQPVTYKGSYFAYVSDKNGIYNRYLAEFDSTISFVDTTEHFRYFFKTKAVTNQDRAILEQDISLDGSKAVDLIYANGKDMILVTPLPKLENVKKDPLNTWYRGFVSPAVTNPEDFREPAASETATNQKAEFGGKGIDFNNYRFEGEKKQAADKEPPTAKKDSVKKTSGPPPFRFPQARNYYTSFYTDYIVTQFDNSFLANNYQVFSGGGSPIYINPGFNFLTKIGVSDLFEDQRIVGGFRVNPSLDNELMMSWEQRKRRWDHQALIDRQFFSKVVNQLNDGNPYYTDVTTYSFRYSMKYPFSTVSAVRMSFLFRDDRIMPLSYGDQSLRKSADYRNLGGLRFEYIYDNTRRVMLNILNGFRFKTWTELWMYADKGGNYLFTSGFDARHYQRIHRQITWCNRLAGGNSLGTKRLIFYLGGVDNWLTPEFNNNVAIVNPSQYGFQTIATNMRGFAQNIRNGNNFLLYNTELRIPIIRYFTDFPLRSDFLNNLQVIGFTDIGMAWYGANPLSVDNTQNEVKYTFTDPSRGTGGTYISVTVEDKKNPLVGGVGFGFRSRILGYFVRLDFGYGIDNWTVVKKVVSLSFATDF